MSRERLLVHAFVRLADTLVDDYDVIDLLDRLVGYSVELLAADSAGILLTDARNDLQVLAATDDRTEWLEMRQLQIGEGPGVDCVRTGEPVSVEDLATAAARWPRFAAAMRELDAAGSVHALPLRLRAEAIGALNLFHRSPGPLPAADLELGQALADVATIGILAERLVRQGEVVNEQLQTALSSRVVIEQAKGMLAERGSLDMGAAFALLRGYARRKNMRISAVATEIVEGNLAADVLALPADAPPDGDAGPVSPAGSGDR